MKLNARFAAAFKIASLHFAISALLAIASAIIVLWKLYPYPYRELSGGRELFLLIVGIDIICGPLLTFILFNPKKSQRELTLDLSLVAAVQLSALFYGVWTTWQARPIYLALEVDRFKVVMSADIDHAMLAKLPPTLSPYEFGGVRTVALRPPKSVEEKNKVLFQSIEGGRDYAERPEFYIPYEGASALQSLLRAKAIDSFLDRYPEQRAEAESIANEKSAQLKDWKYLPVVGRQDWIALLDQQGMIQGFLKGDGF